MNDALSRQLVAAIYASPLVADAIYTDASGADIPVKIKFGEQPSELVSSDALIVSGSRFTMRVRVSDVEQPNSGDIVTHCGSRYRVTGVPKRAKNSIEWILDVTP